MIITSKQFLSSLWLVIALIVATLLAIALPATVNAQNVATNQVQVKVQEGFASWYNLGQHGAKTASGERYDHKALTAAHPSLPFDTMVQVTNLDNNQTVVVRINDRLRSGAEHIIDLSGAAAKKIGLFESGTAPIRVGPANTTSVVAAANKTDVTPPVMGPPTEEPKSTAQTSTPTKSNSNTSAIPANAEMYTLQIGSFSTQEGAQQLAVRYKEAWVSRVEQNGEVSYRVYYSRFDTEKPARVAQNDLWVKGQDSFLRKVGP